MKARGRGLGKTTVLAWLIWNYLVTLAALEDRGHAEAV